MAAAGDGSAYIGVGVLRGLCRGFVEQLFDQIRAAGEVEFFGKDSEGVF
jgi:hypothetical protein